MTDTEQIQEQYRTMYDAMIRKSLFILTSNEICNFIAP